MDVAYHKNQKRNKKKTAGRPSVFQPGKIGFQIQENPGQKDS